MTDPSAAILDEIAALGPFFAFEPYGHTDGPPPEPWRPMAELTGDHSTALSERVSAVRAHLAAGTGRRPADIELRVAASVTHLGLTARLVSPYLALTALQGRPPRLDLTRIHWQPRLGGVFPLALPHPTPAPDPHPHPADPFLEGPVHELVEATAAFSVSRTVLWGNVASAVNGAVAATKTTNPALVPRIRDAAATLLGHPRLLDTFARDADDRFQRRSCCLIYRAAPDTPPAPRALCADCVLAGEAVQRSTAASRSAPSAVRSDRLRV